MAESHIYVTNVQWSVDRKGKLSTNGMPTIEVATPVEFPKGHPNIWSPEHLYVGAAEVCLMTTFLAVAEKAALSFLNYTSKAEGRLEKTEDGFLFTEIVIYPRVVVTNQEDVEKARTLFERAKRHCLISNSMKTKVTVELTVIVKS